MKKSARIWVSLLPLVPCLIAGTWFATYPDYSDPKNIHYVFWKWGLARIDPDRALSVMVHDVAPDHLVVGSTEEELRRKFGYLRSLNEVRPYLRDSYLNSDWNGKTVKFLRDSDWMVVFENGKATELVLVKG